LNTTGVPSGNSLAGQPLDRALTAKLRAQLSQSPRPGMAAISPETVKGLNIRTDKGRVILQGEVKDEAMRDAIIRSASQVPGIGDIDDRLTIQNRPNIGAPAGAQTGQSPQNELDLNDSHPELIPQP
jgi:hypothetical protein